MSEHQPNLPGYRIVRSISESKRAHVYLAEQTSLQRLVALKVLSGEVSDNEASRKRVIEDGKAAARLTHPNLLSVFDIGEADGRYYIATEYVQGGTLRERMGAGGLSVEQAILLMRDLTTGLKFLHSQGFLHRDIKPTNVFYREDGTALLGEAGVARAVSGKTPENEQVAFGSPHYMSPERAQALPSDARSDQYSLGVVFWEALTGKPPFNDDDAFQVAIKHITEPVPALPANYAFLTPIMARCLAKQPEQRFATSTDLLSALDTLIQQRGINTPTAQRFGAPAPTVAPTMVPVPEATRIQKPFDMNSSNTRPVEAVPEQGATTVMPPAARAGLVMPDVSDATAVMMPTALQNAAPPIPPATMMGQRPTPPATPPATMAMTRPIMPVSAPNAPPTAAPMGATAISQPFMPPAANIPAPPVQPIMPPMASAHAAVPPPPGSFQVPSTSLSAPGVAKKGSSAAGWLIWLGVLGLISAAGAAWWVLKGSKEQAPREQPTTGNQTSTGRPATAPTASAEPAQAAVSDATTASPVVPAADEITILLERGKTAFAQNDFVNPDDQCAAYYYQQALKIDPESTDAQIGLDATQQSTIESINVMLAEGNATKAQLYLQSALKFFPDSAQLKELEGKIAAQG
jgi:serine/threonine-protein kinase PpkA